MLARMATDRAIPLDRYDPWPTRLVLTFIGLIGLTSTIAITVLLAQGHDVQGFFTVPSGAILALSMSVSRRPPWTATTPTRP